MGDIALMDGDFVVEAGDIVIYSDDTDIIQQAINNINTMIGSNVFHPDYGNNALHYRMKYTDSYIDRIEESCRQAIELDNRVSNVNNIIATLSDDDKSTCTITFTLTTIEDRELTSICVIELRG